MWWMSGGARRAQWNADEFVKLSSPEQPWHRVGNNAFCNHAMPGHFNVDKPPSSRRSSTQDIPVVSPKSPMTATSPRMTKKNAGAYDLDCSDVASVESFDSSDSSNGRMSQSPVARARTAQASSPKKFPHQASPKSPTCMQKNGNMRSTAAALRKVLPAFVERAGPHHHRRQRCNALLPREPVRQKVGSRQAADVAEPDPFNLNGCDEATRCLVSSEELDREFDEIIAKTENEKTYQRSQQAHPDEANVHGSKKDFIDQFEARLDIAARRALDERYDTDENLPGQVEPPEPVEEETENTVINSSSVRTSTKMTNVNIANIKRKVSQLSQRHEFFLTGDLSRDIEVRNMKTH